MKALILAAGCARRLRPLTDHTPKCLLEVGGKAILGHTLSACLHAGLNEIKIVTGYLEDQIQAYCQENFPQAHISYVHNAKFETTNNIYSLYLARDWFQSQEFMLLDSDIIFSPKILTDLMAQPCTCLAVNSHDLGDEEIKVIADSRGFITEISKTCSAAKAIGESVGIEFMKGDYSHALAQELELMVTQEGMDNVFYERAFERLIPQGFMFKAINTSQYFSMEIDTPQDLHEASERVKTQLNSAL